MTKRTVLAFIYSCFAFVLIYLDETTIGGLKLSIAWKMPIIAFLLFRSYQLYPNNKLLLLASLLALKLIINTHVGFGFVETVTEMVYIMVLPVVYLYSYNVYKDKPEKLQFTIVATAMFFLLSALPFLFGFLEQKRTIELLKSGEDTKTALTGIFYHMAGSSQVFVLSTTAILFNYSYFKRKKVRALWYGFILYGCFVTYEAYTRTGWILLFLAIFFYVKSKIKIAGVISIAIFMFIGLFLALPLLSKNSFFYKRLIGDSAHNTNQNLDANAVTSGRLAIWAVSVENVVKEGTAAIFLGIGKDYDTYLTGKKFAFGLSAHNRVIEIFDYGGLIAIVIFIFYVFRIRKTVFEASKENKARNLSTTYFYIMLISFIPSHGFYIYSDFLFGLILAYAAALERKMAKERLLLQETEEAEEGFAKKNVIGLIPAI